MRILHINSYFSRRSFFEKLYLQQIKDGLDINVYVPIPDTIGSDNFQFGNYTTVSPNHKNIDRFFFFVKHRKIYIDIRKKYNIKRYSFIHAHSLFSNGYIAMKLKRKYDTPFLVTVRNTDINLFFKRRFNLRKTGIQILKEADKIIFLSEPYKEMTIEKYVPKNLKEIIYNKSKVIPNGIDDFWLENRSGSQLNKTRQINLLFVGDISKNKNILSVVRVVELLIKSGVSTSLTVVGKVQDTSIFKKINKYSYVNYIESVKKEELIKIYRQNDIFIMPSITETFGLVYAEAMSQGLPIIYSKNQGFDMQFPQGEVGYAVNSYDINEMKERVLDIVNNYSMISKNCKDRSVKFAWSNISQDYINIYNDYLQ